MNRLTGLIAAVATPLDAVGAIDLPGLAAHCERLLRLGCDGLNLLGTTGEATSFSVEQRLAAMQEIARTGLPLDRVMVGTGAAALADAARLTRAAMDLGYAGALVLPPFYYKGLDVDSVTGYFRALLAAVGFEECRIYLYNFPQNTGVPFALEIVDRLVGEFPLEMRGLKDSSGDHPLCDRHAGQAPAELRCFSERREQRWACGGIWFCRLHLRDPECDGTNHGASLGGTRHGRGGHTD